MKNMTDVLTNIVSAKGLPVSISTFGRATENWTYALEGMSYPIIGVQISLKGRLNVKNDDMLAFDDFASLMAVLQAVLNNKFYDDYLLVAERDGCIDHVPIHLGEPAEANSCEVTLIVRASDVSDTLALIGERVDVAEIEDDPMGICDDYCYVLSCEKEFSTNSGMASLMFSDGSNVNIGRNANGMTISI